MKWLASSPYRVIPLDDALTRLDDGSLPERSVVITIDDGWFSTYRGMMPILTAYSLPATLYATTYYVRRGGPVLNVLLDFLVTRAQAGSLRYEVLLPELVHPTDILPHSQEGRAYISRELARATDSIPDFGSRLDYVRRVARDLDQNVDEILESRQFSLMTADEIRQVFDAGIDIQLHTHTHRMHDMDAEKVACEIDENRAHLAAILNRSPRELRHFCFPSGAYRPEVFATLRRAGISSATTTEPGLVKRRDERLRLPRVLDCESMSQLEFEARLSGFWYAAEKARVVLRRLARASNPETRSA